MSSKKQRKLLDALPAMRRDPATWAKVRREALPPDRVDAFDRNLKAVHAFVRGASYDAITAETGLSPRAVRMIFKRCIATNGFGDILGEIGCIPFIRLHSYVRVAPVTRSINSGRGHCAGAMQQLFNTYEGIEAGLLEELLKQANGKKISEARISVVDLHKVFLNLCRVHGLEARGEWPFNTHSLGRSALAGFVKRVSREHPEEYIKARYGEDARLMTETGRGVPSLLVPQVAYDIVGLDELTFDAISTVTIDVPGGGEQDVAISRIGVILVVEFSSKPILSYHAYYTPVATAGDIRTVVQKWLTPWTPREFTIPGLTYGLGNAGFPSGLIPGLAYHPCAVLLVDNLLAHQDMRLLSDLQSVLGCLINLGPVRRWYRRAILERAIKEALVNGAQRLPSTTGSHPTDTRKDDPVRQAVNLRIRWKDVRQVLEVVLAQKNATPNEGIGGLAPVDLLRQLASDDSRGFLRRPLARASQTDSCIKVEYTLATVRGSQAKGRRPYINLDRARYTNPRLANSWHLIGKQLQIGVDGDRYRSVTAAVADDGEDLGVLNAMGAWSHSEHSRSDRKAINSLRDRKVLMFADHVDPMPIYLAHCRDLAAKQSRHNTATPRIAPAASKLAEVEERRGKAPPPLVSVPNSTSSDAYKLLVREVPADNVSAQRQLLRAKKKTVWRP